MASQDLFSVAEERSEKSEVGVVGSGEGCANRGDKVDPAQFDAANKKWSSKHLPDPENFVKALAKKLVDLGLQKSYGGVGRGSFSQNYNKRN